MKKSDYKYTLITLLLSLILLLTLFTSCRSESAESDALTTEEAADTSEAETTAEETTEEETAPMIEPMSIVDASKRLYSYDEMIEDLLLLELHYSAHVSVCSVGKSLDNREIYCAVLGDEAAEKQIVIHAGIHGREYMTSLLTMRQLEYYLSYYDTATYKASRSLRYCPNTASTSYRWQIPTVS